MPVCKMAPKVILLFDQDWIVAQTCQLPCGFKSGNPSAYYYDIFSHICLESAAFQYAGQLGP